MGLLQEKLAKYDLPQKFMAGAFTHISVRLKENRGTEVEMGGHEVLMFGSNAYTGLTEMKELLKQVYKPCTSMVPVVPVHVFERYA